MPSLPARLVPDRAAAVRTASWSAMPLLALLAIAMPAAAQDTTSVPKPPAPRDSVAVPVKDSAAVPARKDSTSTPAVPKDSTSAPAAAKDSARTPAPASDSATATLAATRSGMVKSAADSTALPVAPPAIVLNVAAPSADGTPSPKPADSTAAANVLAAPPAAPATPASALTVQPSGSATAPAEVAVNAGVLRADSLFEAGLHDAAISEYKRAIGRSPMDSDTWYALGETFFEMGRTKEAVETYTLALTTIEHAPELRLPFAERLVKAGRKGEAIKVLQRGIEIDPDASEEMKALLGGILMGALDAAAQPDRPAAGSAAGAAGKSAGGDKAASTTRRAASRVQNKKKKKLCNLFCPGTFPVAPKK